MHASFLLVHSPLLGPSSWAAFRQKAVERGADVEVPDLTPIVAAEPPGWQMLVGTAVAAASGLDDSVVVVGHSGAGAYMPQIGKQLGVRLGTLIFVDAVVPPRYGAHRTPPDKTQLLDAKTVDGTLMRWLDWWPANAVEGLLPDPADRVVLTADMPRLPRSFYDEAVPVPEGWSDRSCGYLKLSEPYTAEFEEAGNRGWPRTAVEGTHLSIHTEPDLVLQAIESLLNMFTV